MKKVVDGMRGRFVYCQEGSRWAPQTVSSIRDRDTILAGLGLSDHDLNIAKEQNPLHGGHGTLVVSIPSGKPSARWIAVADALEALQVSPNSYRFVGVNTVARSFAGARSPTATPADAGAFRITQRTQRPDGTYEDGLTAMLRIPPDFFAIRGVAAVESQDSQWKYLIGLAEGAADTRLLDRRLVMFVMIDLDVMASANAGTANMETAKAIRTFLTSVFRTKDCDGADILGGEAPASFYRRTGIR